MRGTWLSRIPIWNLAKLKLKPHSALTGVTANQHHTKYTNAEAVAAMGAKGDANPLHHDKAVGEGHITILPISYDSIGQGTWGIGLSSSRWLYGGLWNATEADGDNILWQVYLDAGTYTLLLVTITGPSRGIIDLDIDATEVASFDCYSASPVKDVRQIQTSISVASAGLKTLKERVDGKNASSSSYRADISYIALWRPA